MTVAFFAPGVPQPQGNKTAFHRGGKTVLVEGRRGKARSAFTEWRATVRIAASAARGDTMLEGPVRLRLHFALPRPKSAPKTRRTSASKRPDLDKLTRAALDAMTEAAVWGDDAQVVQIAATKDYPGPDGRTGVWAHAEVVDAEGLVMVDTGVALLRDLVDAQAVPA